MGAFMLNQKTLELAKEISDYFEVHPRAADSSEGIRKWWLTQKEDLTPENVNQALEYLCDKNVVKKTVGKTGYVVYSSSVRDNNQSI